MVATMAALITREELGEAKALVEGRTIDQLTAGVGPHKDTVLAVLAAQRQMTGQTLAQIHAVTLRLTSHPDKKVGRQQISQRT